MSYQKFLGREEVLVLPYLGGAHVDAENKRLRVVTRPEKTGWYSFVIKRGEATVRGPAEPPDLTKLPKVRGHLFGTRLVREGARAEPLHLLPDDEPPRFSLCIARRWHSGELLFEALEFDTDAEEAVRRAFEDNVGLANLSGVPATLRAAFGYALLERVSARLHIPFAPAEVRSAIATVAQDGVPSAEAELRRLVAEREQSRREMAELHRRRQEQAAREELAAAREARVEAVRQLRETVEQRAERALRDAGAELRSLRRVGDHLEVIFTFMNERFISLVDAATLQVVDSGICLGHPPADEELTLESLPSVIREAIDTDALVILRHA